MDLARLAAEQPTSFPTLAIVAAREAATIADPTANFQHRLQTA
jgi:hypothetical protein